MLLPPHAQYYFKPGHDFDMTQVCRSLWHLRRAAHM